jgi:hypothetical protein
MKVLTQLKEFSLKFYSLFILAYSFYKICRYRRFGEFNKFIKLQA